MIIPITLSSGLNCNSNGTGTNVSQAMTYSENTSPYINGALMPFLSYSLSRNTNLQEQLDFSGSTKGMCMVHGVPQQCTLLHETTSPDSNGNSLSANVCYGLLLGSAQCLRMFQLN